MDSLPENSGSRDNVMFEGGAIACPSSGETRRSVLKEYCRSKFWWIVWLVILMVSGLGIVGGTLYQSRQTTDKEQVSEKLAFSKVLFDLHQFYSSLQDIHQRTQRLQADLLADYHNFNNSENSSANPLENGDSTSKENAVSEFERISIFDSDFDSDFWLSDKHQKIDGFMIFLNRAISGNDNSSIIEEKHHDLKDMYEAAHLLRSRERSSYAKSINLSQKDIFLQSIYKSFFDENFKEKELKYIDTKSHKYLEKFQLLQEMSERDRSSLEKYEIKIKNARVFLWIAAISFAVNLSIGVTILLIHELNLEQDRNLERVDSNIKNAREKLENYSWDMASANLEHYYQRNLVESKAIFWVSLIAIFSGFIVIVLSLMLEFGNSLNALYIDEVTRTETLENPRNTVVATPHSNLEERAEEGTEITAESFSQGGGLKSPPNSSRLGILAGILANFIGATFIVIYRITNQESARYSQALERINAVGMAMEILKSTQTEEHSVEVVRAKIDLATKLVENSQQTGDST
ncbi:hypothetical protein [Baaleninema sp.]|uniref:hypothetical protein n=1 Tax=Baaleninema sp. TaxID=3101197 RepID=UPI003D026AAE